MFAVPALAHMEEVKDNLITIVRHLSCDIGERSYRDVEKLNKAAVYIEDKLRSYGCAVKRQPFAYKGNTYYNIIGEVEGTGVPGDEILIIGAHYDTVRDTPGADDNASGVAGLLELARLTVSSPLPRTVRFIAFSLEEPPVFLTSRMGSYIYAKWLREEGSKVYGMISLEMLGYYSNRKKSQHYPLPGFRWFYPDSGNFIAFVGNIRSKPFTIKVKNAFEAASSLPVESLNAPAAIPGVSFSDHRSFWKFGYPAFMITDTAFYRNPYYHSPGDTASTLDYERMARLVMGLYKALYAL
jgi:Zn-dependent M28 family amino/carboxypeptidase